jgi:tetratricopeptide (TPR) repeat protein
VASAALVVVAAFARADPPAARTPIPFPSLEGMEAPVAAQLGEVRARVEEAERARTADAALYGGAGQRYQAYELHAAAEACYRNAEALAPGDFRWPYLLGVLYEQSSRLDDAAAAYTRALAPADKYYPAFIRLAGVELERGRLEAAAAALEAPRRHAPDDAALLGALGQLALAQGRHADAVRDLGAALERQPKATRLHYPLGMAWRALGRLDEARAHLAQVGRSGVQPRDPLLESVRALRRGESAYLIEGHTAYRAGDFAAAAAAYARAFEAGGSTNTGALVNLAAAEARLGRTSEALDHLEQARRLAPDSPSVLFNLGALLAGAGRPAEALVPLRRLLALAPRDDEARLELALAAFAAGEPPEALDALEPLARVAPARCAALVERLNAASAGGTLAARAARTRERLRAAGQCAP